MHDNQWITGHRMIKTGAREEEIITNGGSSPGSRQWGVHEDRLGGPCKGSEDRRGAVIKNDVVGTTPDAHPPKDHQPVPYKHMFTI